MQENQRAAQIGARHNIFPQMVPYYVMNLFGAGPGALTGVLVSRSRGEIVSHNTTDA